MLDFSVLKDLGKVAIHCATERDAETLLNEMWAQHPELMDHWRHGETKWDWYKKNTCYAPHIYMMVVPRVFSIVIRNTGLKRAIRL